MIMPMLAVKDIAASIAYYRDQLGFNLRVEMPGPDGATNFAIVNLGNNMFALSGRPAEGTLGNGVVLMVYVENDFDIDAYYQRVKTAGANILSEIKDEYWGDRCFMVSDLDGYLLMPSKEVQKLSDADIIAAHVTQNA